MLKENVMKGSLPRENDSWGIGVARTKDSMKTILEPTLCDRKVTTSHDTETFTLTWEPCEDADRYRVDIFHIEDRGPKMGDLNYCLVQSVWVTDCTYTIKGLLRATSYTGIIFAFKGDEWKGRYTPTFCILASPTAGDMLADCNDDYTAACLKASDGLKIDFETLPAEKSVLLNLNPDRGFRAEEDYFVPAIEDLKPRSPDSYLDEARRRIEKNVQGERVTVSRVYFILNKYVNCKVLPDAVFDFMQGIFDAYRKLGIKMYLCHYYQHGCMDEPVSEEIVMAHLSQLHPIWEKNKDILHAMNFTFLGCYGEWTCMRKPVDRQKFVTEFMRVVPEEIRLIMRHPMYKKLFVNPEYYRYPQIGFADDACHGLMFSNIDLGQGYTQPGSEWWEYGKRESAYTLNDGEFFTTRWIRLSGSWPRGLSCMRSLSERHETTFSIQHGWGDICQFGGDIDQTCFQSFRAEEVTPEILKELGLHATDGWFIDEKGNSVCRNAFEYIRDYLGYRISAENLTVDRNGDLYEFTLNLKNYGYGAAFNLKSSVLVLDEKGNVIYDISAGDPESFYSTDPEVYENRELLTHTVSASIPAEYLKSGVSVGFKLYNSIGQTARLDNTTEYKNGVNILFRIGE